MTYEDAQVLSQLASLVLFLSLAVGILFYTFRPSNKSKFERAAKLPLQSEE
ncbi:MAG: cbb3-type cytochrome c oxidase subunit 3 [Hyphomicrobium sp.]